MTDEKMARAQRVFATLCAAFDANGWSYKKDEEKLQIECGFHGDDLPMEFTVVVDADRQLVALLSRLPYNIDEEKRLDLAIAVSVVNNLLVDGSFDFNVETGRLYFRMTSSFIDSEIGAEVFDYMLIVSNKTVDEYNDQFLMIAKGMVSLEDFIKKELNG